MLRVVPSEINENKNRRRFEMSNAQRIRRAIRQIDRLWETYLPQLKQLKSDQRYQEAISLLLELERQDMHIHNLTRQLYPKKQWRRSLEPPYTELTGAILDSYHSIEWYIIKATEALLLNGVTTDAINQLLKGSDYSVERGSSNVLVYRNGQYLWHIPIRFT